MADLRGFLARFRPAAAPGAAGPGGVPVDRVAEREAELAPLFELLAGTVADAAQLVDDAQRDAAGRRSLAERQAAAIVEQARHGLAGTRDALVAAALAQAHAETAAADAEAAALAERLRSRATERRPAVVERAVAPLLVALFPEAGSARGVS